MFTLTIETDNAAFGDDDVDAKRTEIARILREAAQRLEDLGIEMGKLRDVNGNYVGEFILT